MTVATLSTSRTSPTTVEADALVVGVRKGADGPEVVGPLADVITSLGAIGVTGARDELTRLPGDGVSASSIALIGLGDTIDEESLRYAAGSAVRQLTGLDRVALALVVSTEQEALAVLEGAAIASWEFDGFRHSSASPTRRHARDLVLVTEFEVGTGAVTRAGIVAEAVHTVRDLAMTPPEQLSPEALADAAVAHASGADLTVTVLGDAELREGGYGGILGVGQGSSRGPRLVKVEYSPAGAAKHVALVGKGITYDTGGLSLKPAASMLGMKDDMTGAATVLAVTVAAAKLALPVRLTAWLCIAENMPSGSAIRPDDVLTIRGGTTVEVTNTDAEGRLVMADGLVAASEEHPDAIIDVATLTGAQVVALGTRYVGVMGDSGLAAEVVATADAAGETFWHMPLPGELRSRLNSDVADLVNATPGNTAAGMLLAGVFLQEFVGKRVDSESRIPWAHLDIAGPSVNKGGGWGFTGKGSTGVAVRTLIELADKFSAA
ncbi:leucyl aminopeptidase [Frigoribacterium sp. 2-23]|uniref:leucyl aminopeptidase n=1 Tax=Frigoribacterium sp. 2-23 TaxID=3415006 RepID=UPI003C6F9CD3